MNHDELSAVAPEAFGAVFNGFLSVPRPGTLKTAHTTVERAVAVTMPKRSGPESIRGFTLVELLVSVVVLVLLVLLFTQLLDSAASITTVGHKRMDADSQAREVLDRMAIDLAQMFKRPDVEYYLKSASTPPFPTDCAVCGPEAGNDQLAFYSTVAGYYATSPSPAPSFTQKSPASLVSYRINSNSALPAYNRMERLGKGLAWNGFSSTNWTPVVFLPQTISGSWSFATNTTADDSSYEVIGPQVFRFEYYYLLKNGQLSSTPWYTVTTVHGLQDVSAIVVAIAGIDPKSRVLLDNSAQVPPPNDNITLLAGALADYNGQAPGGLLAQWRVALDSVIATGTIGSAVVPRPAIQGVRLHERYFYLNQ